MRRFIGPILLLLLLISGCSSSASGAQVWIDVPLNNLYLTSPQTINIEGHASSPEGVALVEVWVNGVIIEGIDTTATTESIINFTSSFEPSDFGEENLEIEIRGELDGDSMGPEQDFLNLGGTGRS